MDVETGGGWPAAIFLTVVGLFTTLVGAVWKSHDKRLAALESQLTQTRHDFSAALKDAIDAAEMHSNLKMESVRESIEGIRQLVTTMHEANVRLISDLRTDVREYLRKDLS